MRIGRISKRRKKNMESKSTVKMNCANEDGVVNRSRAVL